MMGNQIIEDVLKDIRREADDYISDLENVPYDLKSPKEKIDFYHKYELRPDAERRQYAIESYFKYHSIKGNHGYKKQNDFMYYMTKEDSIKITVYCA